MRPGNIQHFLDMLRLVDLQARDHPVSNAVVIVNECHWAHHLAHPKRRHELVAGGTRAVDCNPGQTVLPAGEWHMLRRSEPVAEKVLTHRQA
ncbi:hypothetical protein D3C76_1668340 [compost metagenome]